MASQPPIPDGPAQVPIDDPVPSPQDPPIGEPADPGSLPGGNPV